MPMRTKHAGHTVSNGCFTLVQRKAVNITVTTDGRTDGAGTEDELSKNTAFSTLYIARAAA